MAFKGNSFALLGDDGGDEIESLLARVAVTAAKVAEETPSTAEKRQNNVEKPMARRSFDHEKGRRDQGHGSERHNRNAVDRFNRQENGTQQNNGGRRDFRLNDGYNNRHYERRANGNQNGTDGNNRQENGSQQNNGYNNRHYEGQANANQYDERQNTERPRNNANEKGRRDQGYGSERHNRNDVDRYNRQDNGFQQNNNGFQQNNNGYNNRHYERRANFNQKDENQTDGNGLPNTGRPRNNADGYVRAPRESGYGWRKREVKRDETNGSEVKISEDKQKNESQGQEGNSDGITYESKELEKGSENNAGAEVNDAVVPAEAEQVLSPEEIAEKRAAKKLEVKRRREDEFRRQEEAKKRAERELERQLDAKRMTLQEYEKQLEEKRKALECVRTEERKVSHDKDFESMHIVEKKKEESIFVKLNSDNGKLKKKVIMDKDETNVPKALVTNFKPAGTNYSGKREENGNGYSRRVKNTIVPPKFEDAQQFPALGGSAKP